MLDMLHNEIQILVGRAENRGLGPHASRKLMGLINQMADAERAAGVAEGEANVRKELQAYAVKLQAAADSFDPSKHR